MTNQFTNEYKDNAFYFWYENDRPGTRSLSRLLSQKDLSIKAPSIPVLDSWMKEYGWQERADALDAQLSVSKDAEVIDKRIKMFAEHARVGEMIIQKGKEYFDKNPVDDANSAIRAITAGVEIQRSSVGLVEAWTKISKMSDSQIIQEIRKLTGKVTPDDEFTKSLDDDEEIIDVDGSDTESNDVL